jgi:hypothetical protein
VSGTGTDILVDHIGFQFSAVVVFSIQIIVVSDLFCFLFFYYLIDCQSVTKSMIGMFLKETNHLTKIKICSNRQLKK